MHQAATRRFPFLTDDRQIVVLVFAAAFFGRLLACQAWWCLDDWGQLAGAAGVLDPAPGFPARILSQHWWWSLVWPVLGLNALAHAIVRMVLHGLAAVAVTRIARRLGISATGSFLAGLVFGASPVAFTVLFWASGIQELLAGFLALWACERWLVGGTRSLLLAAVLGSLSMLAKEPGLGLPILFFATWFFTRNNRRTRLVVILWLLLVAIWEIYLIIGHFSLSEGDPYQTGGAFVILQNLGQYGFWLAIPWPIFPPQVPWPYAGGGFVLWGSWFLWSVRSWRQEPKQEPQHRVQRTQQGDPKHERILRRKIPAAALLATLLSIAPALPLIHQTKPYMAYAAIGALALALGSLVSPNWIWMTRRPVWLGGAVLAASFAGWAMDLRLGVDDPVVRATVLARESISRIRQELPWNTGNHRPPLVIFQQPLRPETVRLADQMGTTALRPSPRYKALGTTGLELMLPEIEHIFWVNSIVDMPPSSFVFCETGKDLEAWGPYNDALLYAAMFDVMVGNNERAVRELLRAQQLAIHVRSFAFNPEIFPISPPEFTSEADRFIRWLNVGQDHQPYSPDTIAAISMQLDNLVHRMRLGISENNLLNGM